LTISTWNFFGRWPMMMQACSARITRGLWSEGAVLWLLLWVLPAAGQPSAAGSELAEAANAAARGGAGAAEKLAALAPRYPNIADYIAYWRAQALAGQRRYGEAAEALGPVWRTRFPSPVAARAAVLGADALVRANRAAEALALLRRTQAGPLPEPQATMAAARAYEALGERAKAAEAYQRVYCLYPASPEAEEAARALAALAAAAPGLPPAPEELRMERADRLAKAGRRQEARKEWLTLARSASTAKIKDLAETKAAVVLYEDGKTREALASLLALRPADAETDAMRLHYILLCHRRLDDAGAMVTALGEVRRRAPGSTWTLESLVQAGNYYLVRNDAASYLPLFRACADQFVDAPPAAGCHWKVAWRAYLDHREDAEGLLKEHLERYPASDRAGAALYYLGKIEESKGNSAAAQAYYTELRTRFPNYYYSVLASSRPQPAAGEGGSVDAARRFLSSIRWPKRPEKADFQPDAEGQWRIERARLLAAASLEVWAEIELRFGARNGAARYALALEAAGIAARRGAWGAAVRHIRGVVPEYLWLPREAAPRRFWELAFPFPYREAVRREARKHGIDPLLMAALIRQESEFDKDAVSPSGAIGLMQVMPATGRELGRRLRMGPVTRRALHDPMINLRLGAYFLARQIEARGGSVEEALAAYNAGPTRVPIWKEWGNFREPAEFVETIPFAQTREYVQIILRNLEFYRWLYGEQEQAAAGGSGSVAGPAENNEAKGVGKPPVKKYATKAPAPAKAAPKRKPPPKKGTPTRAGKR
jgi:soluble lytic murein transglycosylase